MACAVVLEAALAALFYQYKDRYLLAWGIYALAAVLLAAAVWAWGGAIRHRTQRPPAWGFLLAACVTTVACLGLTGREISAILRPPQFDPDQFGIAVATFGEGSNFRATETGFEISSLLYKDLSEAIATDPELAGRVAARRIGVIGDDSEQARADGDSIGADLVIWGRLVAQGKSLYAYFRVLQAPDLLDNPASPQSIPIAYRALESTIRLPYDPANSALGLEKTIARQSLGIAAFSLGLAHLQNLDYRLAAEQFENALDQLQPGSAGCQDAADGAGQNLGLIFFYLGRSYQMLGSYAKSQAMLDAAAVCSPDDLAVLLGQSYNYRVMGEEELQRQTLDKIIKVSKDQPSWAQSQAAYDRALAFEMFKNDAAALREYEAIIRDDPTFFIAYLGAAGVLRRQEKFAEAEERLAAAEPLTADNRLRQVWLAFARGLLNEERGDAEAAIRYYLQARELDESDAVASLHFHLANLYAAIGDNDAATSSYEDLLEASDVGDWAHGAFATFLYKIGDYARAVDEYAEALRFESYNEPMLHAQLGMAYTAVDEHSYPDREQLALAEFEKAVQNPGDIEAYVRSEYGHALYRFGRTSEAITQFELSLAADEDIAVETRQSLGVLYKRVDKTAQAVAMYRSIMELCEQIPLEKRGALLVAQEQLHALGAEIPACAAVPVG